MTASRRIAAYVPDLMDRSKVAAAGAGTVFVGKAADLPGAAQGSDLVVVDLGRPGVLEAVALVAAASDVPVIGFANHAQRELMDAALAAGCSRVMARSAFFAQVGDLLGPGAHE